MDTPTECLMNSILENDQKVIMLNDDIHINKICRNGMTLIGAAAKTGNLPLLQLLIDFHNNKAIVDSFEKRNKPQNLQLDNNNTARCKNIGYFVITRDEENDFGDGPTPEGMEGLEWDLEVNDANISNTVPDAADASTEDLYKWYASILNRTAVLLDSPDRDFGRLDKHGHSVLHYAADCGHIEIVEYLLKTFERELDVNQNDITGYSSLHNAVARGDLDMASFLINKGADVNGVAGRLRLTPLHIAAQMGLDSMVLLLINIGSDIDAFDAKVRTPLSLALRQKHITTAQILIEGGCCVNGEEYDHVSPLCLAVFTGSAPVVVDILSFGAKIIPSYYLLHKAIMLNSLEVVRALIRYGALINSRDPTGFTPVMAACSMKNLPILKYLIRKGANVNIKSHIDGKTALHVCSQDVRSESTVNEIIDVLVNSGANMNATSYQGSVLLYTLILENHYAAIALIRHGANVNIIDERLSSDVLSVSQRYSTLDVCKATVYAGFKLRNMSCDPKKLRKGPNDDICDFILHVKSNPLNLKDLCRIAIRKNIGTVQLLNKIRNLPLPTVLHKYLSLELLE